MESTNFRHVLRVTPTIWWEMHKQNLGQWDHIKRALDMRFGEDLGDVDVKYTREESLSLHMDACITSWLKSNVPDKEWVYQFVHTLGVVPKNWYLHQEL